MTRILLVEDTKEFQNIVLLALKNICAVDLAESLEKARNCLSQTAYNHIIVDIELPDGNGLQFCSEIRNSDLNYQTSITVLTASKYLIDKITGFQIGIDEFLEKPIDYRELRARMESKFKKILNSNSGRSNYLNCGQFHLDALANTVHVLEKSGARKTLELTSTEFRILWALCQAQGRILSRDQLTTVVWGEAHYGTDRTIDSHVCEIRKKLGEAIALKIKTVYGSGYKFE